MKPSYSTALGLGALVGLLLSVAILLLAGATGGVSKLAVVGEGTDIDPAFSIPASALWIVVIVSGAVAGLVLAVATRAITRVIDPASNSAPGIVVGPVGAVIGAVVAIAVFPVGSSVLGEISDGLVVVTVAQMTILTALAGIVIGGGVVWLSYVMARPPHPEADPELLTA